MRRYFRRHLLLAASAFAVQAGMASSQVSSAQEDDPVARYRASQVALATRGSDAGVRSVRPGSYVSATQDGDLAGERTAPGSVARSGFVDPASFRRRRSETSSGQSMLAAESPLLSDVAVSHLRTPPTPSTDAALQTQSVELADTRPDDEESSDESVISSDPTAITLDLPVVFQGRALGSVPVIATPDRLVAVSPALLASVLDGRVDEGVLGQVAQLGGVMTPVETLEEFGLVSRLDSATLSIVVEGPAVAAAGFDYDLTGSGADRTGEISVPPAKLAAGVTGNLFVSQNFSRGDEPTVSGAFDGFLNIGGRRGIYATFGGNSLLQAPGSSDRNFQRTRLVVFRDNLERVTRTSAGDLFTNLSPVAGSADFLGASLGRSYSTLQPNRSIRPLGARSFVLERPAEVSILVNGQQVTRFNAPAGPINLNDFPLVNVTNDISIVVEDDFGRRVLDSFALATDISLLDVGLSEFFVGGGVKRDTSQRGFEYSDDYVLTGTYRRGLTSSFTLGGFGLYSEDRQLAGAEAAFTALSGVAGTEVAFSNDRLAGSGFAGTLSLRADNGGRNLLGRSLELRADYQSEEFRSASSDFQANTEWNILANVRQDFTDRLALTASGSWLSTHSGESAATGSIGAIYRFGNVLLNSAIRYTETQGGRQDIGLFFALTRRFGSRLNGSISHDTISGVTEIEARRFAPNELGAVSYDARARFDDEQGSLEGGVEYLANRWRGELDVVQRADTGLFDGDTVGTARIQSGIAFADGQWGVGRDPGRGFYMVGRHPSLAGSQVNVSAGSIAEPRATTGILGPAVVSTLSSYRPETVQVQVVDAPIGYNIGQGRYTTTPGAFSGFDITVGSDAYRSVVFTFSRDGEPVSLASAVITNDATGEETVAFSNRGGRLLASQLVPGRYTIRFPLLDLNHPFTISEDDDVYVNAGKVEFE
jgi:outer membrane usher protein FimD/PapC